MFYRTKGNKYNNRKTIIDGIKFDSQAEATYYIKLKNQRESGRIVGFECQPTIILQDKFKYQGQTIRAITYKPDFLVYHASGMIEYIDVKGKKTELFNVKWKMLQKKMKDEKHVILTIVQV
jgi:hypothetical protein